MRIVLQHIRSSLYFCSPGNWTRDLGEAYDFSHSQRAIDFACQHRLTGVEVVVAFINSGEVESYAFPIESVAQRPAVPPAI